VVYFFSLGTLSLAESAIFVDLEVVDVSWVNEKPWCIVHERFYSKYNWSGNGVVMFCAVYLFLRAAE
jgi:hypothetical protein